MLGNFDTGHLRIIYVNDLPLLVENTSNIFPIQDMEEVRLLQGGPRSNVYKIGIKRINGSLSIPLYLDKDGLVSDACKEILMCADNPFREFVIKTNFAVMGEYKTALTYQEKWSTSRHKRLTLDPCGITSLKISGGSKSPLSMEVSFIALLDPVNENDYDITSVTSGLMSRHCSLADCIFTRGNDTIFMDTVQEFSLEFKNNIKELVMPWGTPDSHDYPNHLYLGEENTSVNASVTELVNASDWDNERLTWNHGGYARSDEMKMRFADVQARIRDPLYHLQEQPVSPGKKIKKTDITALFRYAWLSSQEADNLIFAELLE